MGTKSCEELLVMMRDPLKKEAAFQAFFKKYQPIVYNYLRYQSNSLTSEDIEDISQEFFLKIYNKAEHVGSFEKSCEAWWRKVCLNTLYSWAKARPHKFDNLTVELAEHADTPDDNEVHKQYLSDHWDCVARIVSELKKTHLGRWKICCLLIMGYERKEIAEISGKSSGATGNILYHIHEQLRTLRKEHCE